MIDVVVIVMAVVVVIGVVTAQRRKASGKRSSRDDLLAGLAPVIGGSVSGEQVLTGGYGGHRVQVTLRSADPTVPGGPGVTSEGYLVEVVQIRLLGAPGGQPWAVWRAPTLSLHGWTWHFARPSDGLPFLGRFAQRVGLPEPDPDLPDRLRAAGILDAFEALGPSNDSFPRARFQPDLRAQMVERLRAAGREPPPSFGGEPAEETGPWLEVEVERAGERDPTPERFRALLDVAVGIAAINARANP